VYFGIDRNSFSGSIPSSLFMLPSLTSLVLGRNDFNGPLDFVALKDQQMLFKDVENYLCLT